MVQVPAASIRGKDGSYTFVWESFDILKVPGAAHHSALSAGTACLGDKVS